MAVRIDLTLDCATCGWPGRAAPRSEDQDHQGGRSAGCCRRDRAAAVSRPPRGDGRSRRQRVLRLLRPRPWLPPPRRPQRRRPPARPPVRPVQSGRKGHGHGPRRMRALRPPSAAWSTTWQCDRLPSRERYGRRGLSARRCEGCHVPAVPCGTVDRAPLVDTEAAGGTAWSGAALLANSKGGVARWPVRRC
jgi:hypothetical protein